MKRIAIITARGGSKRIPRKNIRSFLGQPIICYSIQAALSCGKFDEVMVSTEDEEIAEIALKAGAKVPFFRSEETADDYATTADVIEEVIHAYAELGQNFETICCIYPTAPFVTKERLTEAVALLENNKADTVMPVIRFSFPPQRGVFIEDGHMRACSPKDMLKRSQDLEPIYHDAGQFYCMNAERFEELHSVVMTNTCPLILSELEVQDIDTMEDWQIAEQKYALLHREQESK